MSARRIPVLDIGGTHVTAALVEDSQVHLAYLRALDSHADAETIIGVIASAARELHAPADANWAVSMPGPFDYATGRGSFEGVGKFEALAGMDLGRRLGESLKTTSARVVFVNDADAYALGEWIAHGRPGRVCCVTLGTGVGGGFVEAGRILRDDERVPTDGDLFHLRWQGEPLEEHVSQRALIRAFGAPGLDVVDIAHRARDGDRAAREVFEHAMIVLADVLSPWLETFRPDVLVVGGAIAESWELVGPPLDTALRRRGGRRVEVRSAMLASDAPLVGAAEFLRAARDRSERGVLR